MKQKQWKFQNSSSLHINRQMDSFAEQSRDQEKMFSTDQEYGQCHHPNIESS